MPKRHTASLCKASDGQVSEDEAGVIEVWPVLLPDSSVSADLFACAGQKISNTQGIFIAVPQVDCDG